MFRNFQNTLLTCLMNIFIKNPKKKLLFLGYFFYMVSYSKTQRTKVKKIIKMFKNNHPYLLWWEKVITKLDNNIKKKFVENFFINTFNGKHIKKINEFKKKYGFQPPYSLIISLTSKCNYSCKGCWAKKYNDKSELPYEKWKEILREAKEDMGIFSYYVTGGEPFLREDFFQLAQDFSDCLFFTYTNGSLLTDELIEKIKKLGNIYPMISINSMEGNNEELRDVGTYNNALEKMKKLLEAGIFWGTSTVATKNNIEKLTSAEFYKMLASIGAYWVWIWDFVPSGDKTDIDYILNGEQKLQLHKAVYNARNTYPIITFDFYDAYEVGGCTAAGHRIVHITSSGDVEPCPLIHLSVDNLKNKTLKEAMNSKFITHIRNEIPYPDGNCLRPCLILDRPELLKEYYNKFKPKNTQDDFLNLIFDEKQYSALYQNAQKTKEIMDIQWSKKENLGFFK